MAEIKISKFRIRVDQCGLVKLTMTPFEAEAMDLMFPIRGLEHLGKMIEQVLASRLVKKVITTQPHTLQYPVPTSGQQGWVVAAEPARQEVHLSLKGLGGVGLDGSFPLHEVRQMIGHLQEAVAACEKQKPSVN